MIWLLVALPGLCQAVTAVIYQPLRADMQRPEHHWPSAFAHLQQQGFDTVIFQWTQHGDAFSSAHEQQWLLQRLLDAANAGLDLVVGLYADSDQQAVERLPNDLVLPYARQNTDLSLALAKYWVTVLPTEQLVGWYLPFEIDDRRWRAAGAQAALTNWISREVELLTQLWQVPVYQSVFFAGHSTPTQFAALLQAISLDTSVNLWVQDGSGTLSLNTNEAKLYQKVVTDCSAQIVRGVIFELFEQTSPDVSFSAKPLDTKKLAKALRQRAPCHGNTIFFSLRYLVDLQE